MSTLVGVNEELRARIEEMLRRCPRLWVSSGFRSKVEQQRLFDGYAKRLPGFAPANRPGTSKHEIGFAVDVAAMSNDESTRKRITGECGLHTPIRGEPWHMELAPNRKGLTIVMQVTPAPAADPVRVTEFGEVNMKKLDVHVPQLDRDGNGYIDVQCDPNKIVSFVGQGPNPPKDGYWDAVQFTHQGFGGRTRVTITEGKPQQEVRFGVWVAE